MTDYSILTSAITDVGYWRWWSERLPEVFQLEFGGVQLYAPPEDTTQPPSGLLALRFLCPAHIGFLRRKGAGDELPVDWPRHLQEDRIESFPLSPDEFVLNEDARFDAMPGEAESEDVHFTSDDGGREVRLAFWAGPVGMRIAAAELRPVVMSGEISLADVATRHGAWWTYWRDYWDKRGTSGALPRDHACEVTIPARPESS